MKIYKEIEKIKIVQHSTFSRVGDVDSFGSVSLIRL